MAAIGRHPAPAIPSGVRSLESDPYIGLSQSQRPQLQYSTNISRPRDIDRRRDKGRQDRHDIHRDNGDKDRQDHHDGHRPDGHRDSSGDDSDGRKNSIKDTKNTSRKPEPTVDRHADVPPPRHAVSTSTAQRPSRWQDEDSESDHEKIIHIQCWIPGEGIDLTVLASYLKEYIDDTATIRQSRSPQDRDKIGFTISAQATISVEGLRDLIKDSKLWAAETKSREYRRDPYPYSDSDTWIARKRSGPTPGHQNRAQRQRPK